MPQLVKGGKWVFGWCVVSESGEIQIPPAAYLEYGFIPGEVVIFYRGSHRSGGFSVGRKQKVSASGRPVLLRSIGQAVMHENGRVGGPPGLGIHPGERLLAGRGSGLALGFIRYGPIYEEALKHPGLEVFIPS